MIGHKLGRWSAGVFTFLALSVPPLWAQRTTFNPEVSLQYLFTDNISYFGESGNSDSGFRLGLRLPLVKTFRRGSLGLTYSPKIDRYKDFRELDNTGHSLNLNLDVTPTPLSKLSLNSGIVRTQEQGDPEDPDGEIFLGRRTERERIDFGLAYRNRIAGRFLWAFEAQYADWSFKEIEGFDAGDAEPIGDRNAAAGSIDLLRSVSRTTNFGVRLGYSIFELEQGIGGDVQEFGLVLDHAVAQGTNLQMGLGGFESKDDRPRGSGAGPAASRTGAQGFLTLTRQLRKANLALDAKRSVTAGGILPGTSTDSGVGLRLAKKLGRRTDVGFTSRFARREPHDELLDTIDTVALGVTLGVRVSRRTQLRLAPIYVRQLGNAENADSLVLRGGFGLVWAPFEKTRLGGGG